MCCVAEIAGYFFIKHSGYNDTRFYNHYGMIITGKMNGGKIMMGGEVCTMKEERGEDVGLDARIDKACEELNKASLGFKKEQELYRLVACKVPLKDVLLKIETSAEWTNEEKVKLKTKFEDIYKFNQKQESKAKQLERAKAFLLRNCKDIIDDIHITKNTIRVSLTTLDSQGFSNLGFGLARRD